MRGEGLRSWAPAPIATLQLLAQQPRPHEPESAAPVLRLSAAGFLLQCRRASESSFGELWSSSWVFPEASTSVLSCVPRGDAAGQGRVCGRLTLLQLYCASGGRQGRSWHCPGPRCPQWAEQEHLLWCAGSCRCCGYTEVPLMTVSLWAPCIILSLPLPLAVPGSLAGASLTPAPLLYLDMSSDALAEGDSVRIVCIAPRAYVDSEFWLQKTGLPQPVQMLFASEGQHRVTFILGNVTRNDTGEYRCRYRSYNGSAGQMSEFSSVVEIEVTATPPTASTAAPEASTWLLPVTLSVAGVLLLTVVLVVAVVAIRRVNARRQQLKRDQESCWTETNFPTTDMSFDNCLFTVSVEVSVV
ncbi:protein HIDE1 isoform X2 [Emydura macquarii macquarii]|uniref:protein HIDE1 isoform X2 n=1 Tax=Emydura macquarii macquarii TaxID=1129001 RepID=UPI00352B8BDA